MYICIYIYIYTYSIMVDVMYQKNLSSVPFGSLECLKDLQDLCSEYVPVSNKAPLKIEIVYKSL